MKKQHNRGRAFYSSLHHWLRHMYGKADMCENKDCAKKSIKYEWALKKGKEYDYKRANFIRLCISCHRKYDLTKEMREKMSKSGMGKIMSEEVRQKISKTLTGRIRSDVERANISKGKLGRKMSDETRRRMSLAAMGNKKASKDYKRLYPKPNNPLERDYKFN